MCSAKQELKLYTSTVSLSDVNVDFLGSVQQANLSLAVVCSFDRLSVLLFMDLSLSSPPMIPPIKGNLPKVFL